MSSVLEIIKKNQNKIDNLDLELIISLVIKKPREFILAHPEYELVESLKLKVERLIARRVKGEPLAYILGRKEFYGLEFKVNKNTLIPRPETEMMIDYITHNMEHKIRGKKESIIFIDVGTGSGCIIIALAKKILNNESRIMPARQCQASAGENYEFIGIDISGSALNIARQNAKLNGVNKNIKFLRSNLLNPLIKNLKLKIKNSRMVIMANLPYLTPAQIKNSPSIKYEPKLALDAGRDGLKYYKSLFNQLKKIHNSYYVLCEINPSQTSKIKKIIKNNFPAAKIQIKKDLRGLNRLAVINL